jgi:hypothetical protein
MSMMISGMTPGFAAGTQSVRPVGGGAGGPFAAAASVLGMSEREIARSVAHGTSLGDLAQQKGVSIDDLRTALVEGLPEELAAVADVDALVGDLLTRTGSPPVPASAIGGIAGFSPPSGILGGEMTSAQTRMLESISDLLGTDAESLRASLASGTDLLALIEEKSVDPSKLASVVEESLLYDVRV